MVTVKDGYLVHEGYSTEPDEVSMAMDREELEKAARGELNYDVYPPCDFEDDPDHWVSDAISREIEAKAYKQLESIEREGFARRFNGPRVEAIPLEVLQNQPGIQEMQQQAIHQQEAIQKQAISAPQKQQPINTGGMQSYSEKPITSADDIQKIIDEAKKVRAAGGEARDMMVNPPPKQESKGYSSYSSEDYKDINSGEDLVKAMNEETKALKTYNGLPKDFDWKNFGKKPEFRTDNQGGDQSTSDKSLRLDPYSYDPCIAIGTNSPVKVYNYQTDYHQISPNPLDPVNFMRPQKQQEYLQQYQLPYQNTFQYQPEVSQQQNSYQEQQGSVYMQNLNNPYTPNFQQNNTQFNPYGQDCYNGRYMNPAVQQDGYSNIPYYSGYGANYSQAVSNPYYGQDCYNGRYMNPAVQQDGYSNIPYYSGYGANYSQAVSNPYLDYDTVNNTNGKTNGLLQRAEQIDANRSSFGYSGYYKGYDPTVLYRQQQEEAAKRRVQDQEYLDFQHMLHLGNLRSKGVENVTKDTDRELFDLNQRKDPMQVRDEILLRSRVQWDNAIKNINIGFVVRATGEFKIVKPKGQLFKNRFMPVSRTADSKPFNLMTDEPVCLNDLNEIRLALEANSGIVFNPVYLNAMRKSKIEHDKVIAPETKSLVDYFKGLAKLMVKRDDELLHKYRQSLANSSSSMYNQRLGSSNEIYLRGRPDENGCYSLEDLQSMSREVYTQRRLQHHELAELYGGVPNCRGGEAI